MVNGAVTPTGTPAAPLLLSAGGPTPQTLVAELKKTFTVDDIYRRARRVMELAVRHGCTTMRAHVEVDAYVELRGVEALRRLHAASADDLAMLTRDYIAEQTISLGMQ